jgi:serine/threonine protein kinase
MAMVQNIAYGIPSDEWNEYGVPSLIRENSYGKTYRVTAHDNSFYLLRVNIIGQIPQRMLNEQGDVISFKLSQDLCHENIAQIFHGRYFNETIGQYQYIKTESFDGELLSDKLKREGKLPLDEAVRIFRGILEGLHYLHTQKKPLLVNNITPHNIIINNDGTAKLMNLGHLSIIKIPFIDLPFDKKELDKRYLSPETYHDIYTAQTDIYSASAVFYQMLFGHIPWPTVSLAERNWHSLEESSRTIEPDFSGIELSEAYRKILSQGLRWHMFFRYLHAETIISDIEKASEVVLPPPLQKEADMISIDKQPKEKIGSVIQRSMSHIFRKFFTLANNYHAKICNL